MVGLSNPFCWAWRQKGRPGEYLGIVGVTLGEGSTAGWGGRMGQGMSARAGQPGEWGQRVRLLGLRDRGLGWAWQEAFGPGSFGSASSPYPVRVPG